MELFFKRIKQHLRINAFFVTFEKAVKPQIWIAISVYVLITIIKKLKKRLDLDADLCTMLQILSLSLFEKTPLEKMLGNSEYTAENDENANELNFFDNLTGN